MTFQREPAARLFDEALPLFRLHFDEIAHFKDIPLEPSFEQYARLDDMGLLRVYTARTEEGKLIGYNWFFVQRHPHYKSSLQAIQDLLFIDPGHRGFGLRFLRWCDAELSKEGVNVIYQHASARHDFGPMLKRMGYELVDHVYARRVA